MWPVCLFVVFFFFFFFFFFFCLSVVYILLCGGFRNASLAQCCSVRSLFVARQVKRFFIILALFDIVISSPVRPLSLWFWFL